MASIRCHPPTGHLFVDFRYRGERCREYTALADTPANRKLLDKLLARIAAAIAAGTFRYRDLFPASKNASRFDAPGAAVTIAAQDPAETSASCAGTAQTFAQIAAPTFNVYSDKWFLQNEVRWRESYRKTVRDIIDLHLVPAFGEKVVGQISKDDILEFRSSLAKVRGRKNKEGLSASRINYVMKILNQILTEAADRFHFTNTYNKIKPLKNPKTDIEPFSLPEVTRILDAVRSDYRDYLAVRFFTGMRTGEIDGLKWEYVDFERRQTLVRVTIVMGKEQYTKTDGSQREIHMSPPVFDALKRQETLTRGRSDYVFCGAGGQPIDHNNFGRRVWYPLLRYLGLKARRPYQTRHTAATLWLAAGENPQWIARQLGHSSTKMLFEVYARFVPNLTHQDGSAFERLLLRSGALGQVGGSAPPANETALAPPASGLPEAQGTEEGSRHG